MNYEMFTKEVKRGVENIVRENLGEGIVVIRNVTKNNNVRMKAVSIVRKEEKATPTIYLRSYFNEHKHGRSVEDICREIFDIYKLGLKNFKADIDINDFSNFEKIKGKIYYKLINYELNKILLKDIPYFKFLDMAIVFYIMVSCEDDGQATALIHNQHMAEWGIDCLKLREIAFSNTWKDYPPEIHRMEDIVSEMILDDIIYDDFEQEDEDSESLREDGSYEEYSYEEIENIIREEVEGIKSDRDMEMYVLTNSIRTNGAACITYPGVLKAFAEEHDSDVYIIPSSIHETILIPGVTWKREKLDEMIVEVNENELDPVEVLSDHVYIYRKETGDIE